MLETGCCEQVFQTFFFASLCSFLFLSIKTDWIYNKKFMLHQNILLNH